MRSSRLQPILTTDLERDDAKLAVVFLEDDLGVGDVGDALILGILGERSDDTGWRDDGLGLWWDDTRHLLHNRLCVDGISLVSSESSLAFLRSSSGRLIFVVLTLASR